ncbi:MAG: hypothetical protein Q9P14_07715 [candidate division KSB1 bacterium]|nr:hypothetical protein [candidate division KSB1 bacterium]
MIFDQPADDTANDAKHGFDDRRGNGKNALEKTAQPGKDGLQADRLTQPGQAIVDGVAHGFDRIGDRVAHVIHKIFHGNGNRLDAVFNIIPESHDHDPPLGSWPVRSGACQHVRPDWRMAAVNEKVYLPWQHCERARMRGVNSKHW